MDLSRPDTVCVYCGTNVAELTALRSRIKKLEKVMDAAERLRNEVTISEVIRSAIHHDMAFAIEVPQYAKDCKSIEKVATAFDAALAEGRK